MEDITPLIHQYRECIRHLWNTYFWQDVLTIENADLTDEFDDIASKLFSALVLNKIGVEGVELAPSYWGPKKALNFLQVQVPMSCNSVMVNREMDSGYWDLTITEEELRQTTMIFLHFFDFDSYGFREWGYYLAEIEKSDLRPELVGRTALVPVGSATVVYIGD